jgi:hypothetical protein
VRGAESNLRPYRDLLNRHIGAMDVGAVKAPTIQRSEPCMSFGLQYLNTMT